MKKKVMKMILITSVGVMMCGTTVMAQPKTMSDGMVFDAEYYAQNNPDVVEAFGTDENLLYQHYVAFGKNEGRKPTASEQALQTEGGYVDEYGVYVPSREELMFPDEEQHEQDWRTYYSMCIQEAAAKVVNGTFKRLPIGAVVYREDVEGKTGGYMMQLVDDGKFDKYIVTGDELTELLAGGEREETLQMMLEGKLMRSFKTNIVDFLF